MNSMFDIYTTEPDGRPVLLDSAACLAEAEERASQLSRLFPGAYFAYFERSDAAIAKLPEGYSTQAGRDTWPPSAFLA